MCCVLPVDCTRDNLSLSVESCRAVVAGGVVVVPMDSHCFRLFVTYGNPFIMMFLLNFFVVSTFFEKVFHINTYFQKNKILILF